MRGDLLPAYEIKSKENVCWQGNEVPVKRGY